MKTLENPFLLIGALEHAGSTRTVPLRCNDLSARTEISMETLSFQARIGNQQTTRMDPPRKQTCMGLEGGSIMRTTIPDPNLLPSMADNSGNGRGDQGEDRKRKKGGDGGEDNLLLLPTILYFLCNEFIHIIPFSTYSLDPYLSELPSGSSGEDGDERKRRNTDTEMDVTEEEEEELLNGENGTCHLSFPVRYRKMTSCARANFLFAMYSALTTGKTRNASCARPVWQINPILDTSYYKLCVVFNNSHPIPLICNPNCTHLYRSTCLISKVVPGEETEATGGEERGRRRRRKKMADMTPEQQAARKDKMRARKARKKEKVRSLRAAEAAAQLGTASPLEPPPSSGRNTPGVNPGNTRVNGGPSPKPEVAAAPKQQRPSGKGKGKKVAKGGKVSSETRPTSGPSKPPSLPKHSPSSIVVKRKEGDVGRRDVEDVRRLLLEAAFNVPSSSRSEAPQPGSERSLWKGGCGG